MFNRLTNKNNLINFKHVIKQWNHKKNKNLTPNQFSYGSNKKVWWVCSKNKNHEFEATIYSMVSNFKRSKKNVCPYCAGKKPSLENNLLIKFPSIAKQLHLKKNNNIKPAQILPGSHKKFWWQCSEDKDHIFFQSVNKRTQHYKRTGRLICPHCAIKNQDRNKFINKFPELVKEWHPTKNKNLNINQISSGSHQRVWWRCSRNNDHEWSTVLKQRTNIGTKCPFCSPKHMSRPELRLLSELKVLIGDKKLEWRKRIKTDEIDLFIPSLSIAIEYDGYHWHKDKLKKDSDKDKRLKKIGIQTLRLREKPLKSNLSNQVQVSTGDLTKNDINLLIKEIIKIKKTDVTDLKNYIKKKTFINQKEYKILLSNLPSPPKEFSFKSTHPRLAANWHPSKNGPLLPDHFTMGSGAIVWWKCSKGDDHEWKAAIKTIVNNSKDRSTFGCPFCGGKEVSKNNNLKVKFPKISKQWHPNKNDDLRPEDFSIFANKEVWWQCTINNKHEWKMKIITRTKHLKDFPSCKFCKIEKNSLFSNYPNISKYWHPTKNRELSPKNITFGSHKIVWWQCTKNRNHQWQNEIKSTTHGGDYINCKFCNSLKMKFPKIAKEWHPTKNGNLKPMNVTYGSNMKVWWNCSKNQKHEWRSQIAARTVGRGGEGDCPKCR
tara:strand:+ start:317 stop:2287 length:1971 start_codon:yes stop_codon:yes gene_type:complete